MVEPKVDSRGSEAQSILGSQRRHGSRCTCLPIARCGWDTKMHKLEEEEEEARAEAVAARVAASRGEGEFEGAACEAACVAACEAACAEVCEAAR